MEAVKNLIDLNQLAPYEALEVFFSANTPDSAWEKFFQLLKAWVSQPSEKKQYTDEEIALFLDLRHQPGHRRCREGHPDKDDPKDQ